MHSTSPSCRLRAESTLCPGNFHASPGPPPLLPEARFLHHAPSLGVLFDTYGLALGVRLPDPRSLTTSLTARRQTQGGLGVSRRSIKKQFWQFSHNLIQALLSGPCKWPWKWVQTGLGEVRIAKGWRTSRMERMPPPYIWFKNQRFSQGCRFRCVRQ